MSGFGGKDAQVDAYLDKLAQRRMAGAAVLIGAVLSLTTGYFVSHSGDTVLREKIEPTDLKLQKATGQKDEKGNPLPDSYVGGKKLDLDLEKAQSNQVVYVELYQDPGRTKTTNRTRNVTVELLEPGVDEKTKKAGEKPVYAATPREPFIFEDGDLNEESFSFHMTVKEPKKYGLLIRVSDDVAEWGKLDVWVKTVRASALPFYWGGAAMFLIGLIFTWLGRV